MGVKLQRRITLKRAAICKGCWEQMRVPVPLRGPLSIPFRAFGVRPSDEPQSLHDLPAELHESDARPPLDMVAVAHREIENRHDGVTDGLVEQSVSRIRRRRRRAARTSRLSKVIARDLCSRTVRKIVSDLGLNWNELRTAWTYLARLRRFSTRRWLACEDIQVLRQGEQQGRPRNSGSIVMLTFIMLTRLSGASFFD